MREKVIHFSLLAAGALFVLWLLMRSSKGSSAAAVSSSPNAASSPSYPNSQPIKQGDVSIGGSPIYVNYNSPGDQTYGAEIGNGPNSCECGGQAGQFVNFPTVNPNVAQSALDNLNSYLGRA